MCSLKKNTIEEIVEKFNKAKNYEDEIKYLPDLIEYFELKGPSNFRLNFWQKKETPIEKKESFIRALFNYLISLPSEKKTEILGIIRNLFIDSEQNLKDQFLMIVYAALFEKKNYKISLTALDFFTQMFKFFTDDEKKDIFGKLIDFIQMSDEDIADEGMRGLGDILETLTPKMRAELFTIYCKISMKKNLRLKFVALENIERLIQNYPSEFPRDVRGTIFIKIEKIIAKNLKLKDPKVILSLLRVILLFETLNDEKDEKIIQKFIEYCIKHSVEEYEKEILMVLIDFWKSIKFLSYENGLKKIIPFILKIYHKRELYSALMNELLEQFSQIIWNYIPDDEKVKFY